jgi:hypothetical protein
MVNEWPGCKRKAITQGEHSAWNAENYPGTLEICIKCDEPTGNCEEDNITDDNGAPYCDDCAKGAGLLEVDQ